MWNLIINRGEKVALQVNTIPDETDEKTIFNMLYFLADFNSLWCD